MLCRYCSAEVPGLTWRLCPACGAAYHADNGLPEMVRLPAFHVEGGHRLGAFAPRDHLSDATTAIRFGVEPTRRCMACNRVEIGGDWHSVEPPQERPVSHGICRDCAALAEEG